MSKIPVGDNVVAYKDGSRVVIEIDTSKSLGVSSSGKSEIIATIRSKFGVEVLPDTFLSLNMYKRGPRQPKPAMLG